MNVGETIRYYRKLNKITMKELGKKLEPQVSEATISKWENNVVGNIKRTHIKQMSDIFGISPIVLLGLDMEEVTKEENAKFLSVIATDTEVLDFAKYFFLLNAESRKMVMDYVKFHYNKENK